MGLVVNKFQRRELLELVSKKELKVLFFQEKLKSKLFKAVALNRIVKQALQDRMKSKM